jgi:hypothetical protein
VVAEAARLAEEAGLDDRPFELVVGGSTPSNAAIAHDILGPLADAGATWWDERFPRSRPSAAVPDQTQRRQSSRDKAHDRVREPAVEPREASRERHNSMLSPASVGGRR